MNVQRVFTESQLERMARAGRVRPFGSRFAAGSLCAVHWAGGEPEVVFVRMRCFKATTIRSWIEAGRCRVEGRLEESTYARLVWADGAGETVDVLRPVEVMARSWVRLQSRHGLIRAAYLAAAWAAHHGRVAGGRFSHA